MKRDKKDKGFSPPNPTSATNPGEVGQMLPPLSSEEYTALKESICQFGVRVPILVDQGGKIIDGWHRQQACDELGIYCPREVREFVSEAERLEVAIGLNANRRHLNRQQRRELIAAFLKCDPRINDNHLGKIIGVSQNTVAAVRGELESTFQIEKLPQRMGRDGKERPAQYRRIIACTNRDLKKALMAMRDLPPSNADKIMDVTTAARLARRHIKKEDIAAKVIVPSPDDAIRLYHCPFQQLEHVAGIAPASVQLICTDIPYVKEFLPEIGELAAFAERVLVDGGLFVTYSGQYYLDQVMRSLAEHLTYRWMAASTWNGDGTLVHPRNLMSHWKPILVYSKGVWRQQGQWHDRIHIDSKEKSWHDWQQPISEIETLIRYFSEPGELVVDPCGGGFTTAVACRNLGRRFIGCDVDATCVQRGIERLACTLLCE